MFAAPPFHCFTFLEKARLVHEPCLSCQHASQEEGAISRAHLPRLPAHCAREARSACSSCPASAHHPRKALSTTRICFSFIDTRRARSEDCSCLTNTHSVRKARLLGSTCFSSAHAIQGNHELWAAPASTVRHCAYKARL